MTRVTSWVGFGFLGRGWRRSLCSTIFEGNILLVHKNNLTHLLVGYFLLALRLFDFFEKFLFDNFEPGTLIFELFIFDEIDTEFFLVFELRLLSFVLLILFSIELGFSLLHFDDGVGLHVSEVDFFFEKFFVLFEVTFHVFDDFSISSDFFELPVFFFVDSLSD